MYAGAPPIAREQLFSQDPNAVLIQFRFFNHKRTIISLAVGIIIALGGLFLTLAAFHVLPGGVNAISNMGAAGQLIGLISLSGGLYLAIKRGMKLYQNLKYEQIARGVISIAGDVVNRLNDPSSGLARGINELIAPESPFVNLISTAVANFAPLIQEMRREMQVEQTTPSAAGMSPGMMRRASGVPMTPEVRAAVAARMAQFQRENRDHPESTVAGDSSDGE